MHFLPLILSLCPVLSAVNASPVLKRQQAQADQEPNVTVVINGLGQAHGIVDPSNSAAARFVVKYATAARWGLPVPATAWTGLSDPSAMPPACPQDGYSSSQSSEDCLYAVVYVPRSVLTNTGTTNLPTYVWFHGGSFVAGSATAPGLDGANLALATNSVVVVVQYRLGIFGWLPPASAQVASGNFGVSDAIASLKFVNKVISAFGGQSTVTIGGQSSGGHMVRALIAAPSAQSYFKAATLHADPMAYGFMKNGVYQTLQNDFYSQVLTNCPGSNNLQCLQRLPAATILQAQDNFVNGGGAMSLNPSVGLGEPIRPHFDGNVITNTLTTNYPGTKKPLFITTNKNDAGQVTAALFPSGEPLSNWSSDVQFFVGSARLQTITSSHFYTPNDPALVRPYIANGDVVRQALERVGTDQIWRCPNWNFARRWAANGGTAYVSLFEVGVSYPDNQNLDYCQETGIVCHEDEIETIFGTGSRPNAAQAATTKEFQARLKSFLANPSVAPNPAGYSAWKAATSSNANAVQLGGTASGQAAPVDACAPTFWGSAVQFEWQLYNE